MIEPVEETIVVQLNRAEVFLAFVERFTEWWPHHYTWANDVLEEIGIEPYVNGFAYERGPYGFQCHWGRVLEWQAPQRFVLAWQISPRRVPEPDPTRASTVTVRFIEREPDVTVVTLVHDDFDRHSEGAADYRAAMASPEGWPFILACFAKLV